MPPPMQMQMPMQIPMQVPMPMEPMPGATAGPAAVPMRIAHLLNHTVRANGHVCAAVDLACAQRQAGHDVVMISGPGDFDDCLRRHDVRIARLPDRSGAARSLILRDLHQALKTIDAPQVINAHMVYASVAAKLLRPLWNYALVTTVHNSFDSHARLMKVGDRVIAVSNAVADDMIRRGIDPGRLRVVTNGTIGSARRAAEPPAPRVLRAPAIVCTAGLHPRKGIDLLIRAFAIARRGQPSANLYLVGGGPMRSDYEQLAATLGISAVVHFVGYLEDPREVLLGADLFVLASRRDPCPLVISEAREAALPIIATGVDGIPAALDYGRSGLVVPPDSLHDLAEAIATMLADNSLRQRYATAAASGLDRFQIDRVAGRTVDIYREAIEARARTAPAALMETRHARQ